MGGKLNRTGLLFAALLLVTVFGYLSQSNSPVAHAQGTTVGFDMDPTGNTATSLGVIDRCRSVSAGEQFTLQTFVDEIPAGRNFAGFNYQLNFDETKLRVVTKNHSFLLGSAPGSNVSDLGEGVPDTTTPHLVLVADFGTAEDGPIAGVLGEYTLEALPAAPISVVSLTLTTLEIADSIGNAITVDTVLDGASIPQHGVIAIGQSCPSTGADLTVTKSGSVAAVQAGEPLTYTIQVTNNGPETALNTVMSDPLPADVSLVNVITTVGACGESLGTVTCNLGDMAASSGATITLDVNVSPSATAQVSNTAFINSDTTDPVGSNDADSEVTLVGAIADLSIAMTDSPDPVLTGGELTYNLVVFNTGPSSASSVNVQDILPTQVSFDSATPTQGVCNHAAGTVDCALGDILPNGNATI